MVLRTRREAEHMARSKGNYNSASINHLRHVRSLRAHPSLFPFRPLFDTFSPTATPKRSLRFSPRHTSLKLLVRSLVRNGSTDAIMFIIGTNSVRSNTASRVIEQVTDITTTVRATYPHLIHSNSIAVPQTVSHIFYTILLVIEDYRLQCTATIIIIYSSFVQCTRFRHCNNTSQRRRHPSPSYASTSRLRFNPLDLPSFHPGRIETISVIVEPSSPSSPVSPTTIAKRHVRMERKEQANSTQRSILSGWT